MENWTPKTDGAESNSRPHEPLEPFRDRLLVLSGLNNLSTPDRSTAIRAQYQVYDGCPAKSYESTTELQAGISMDQIVAKDSAQIPNWRRLKSAWRAASPRARVTTASAAFTPVQRPGAPDNAIANAARSSRVFERMFGDSGSTVSGCAARAQARDCRSPRLGQSGAKAPRAGTWAGR